MRTYQIENEVVGYVDGKAIVRDENDQWYFVEIPEDFITPGEQMMTDDLTSLESLPRDEQKQILKEIEEL